MAQLYIYTYMNVNIMNFYHSDCPMFIKVAMAQKSTREYN